MSRSVFGFQKLLWGWSRMEGGVSHSRGKTAHTTAEWYPDDMDRLKVGDKLGQEIFHERNGVIDIRSEVWQVTEVKFGDERWSGGPRDVWISWKRIY